MKIRRAKLTRRERADMILQQGGLCGCGCGQPVTLENGDGEHFVCVFFGNDQKPDSMWRRDCHKPKTAKDQKAIAKVKRILRKLEGTWRPNRQKIQGRGFDKSLRRKFDGTVERRT